MPSTIHCPSCSRQLRVPDELLGRAVQCPTCGTSFTAGAGEAPAARPAPEDTPRPSGRRPAADAPAPGYAVRRDEEDADAYDGRSSPRDRPPRRRYAQAHRGPMIMILGILALVPIHGMALTLILGPIAWILGNNDLKEMKAGRMDPEGESQTNTGRICGMIATILGLVGLLIFFLVMCLIFGLPCFFALGASGK
jgi:predicted Zn finger-like uncharacterized protein